MFRTVASTANLRARHVAASTSPAQAVLKRNLVSSILLSSTRNAYEKKRIAELKDELRSRGLSSSGKKEDMIRRLIDSDSKRAGSNLTQPAPSAPSARTKSTLASLRQPQDTATNAQGQAQPKTEASQPTLGGEKGDAAQATADAIVEADSPLGSLKPSETPANLEAGTVHSAAADGLASGETAKSSPDAASEDPAIASSPPGLPPQKVPQARETFNIQIPYYEEPAQQEAPIPLVTSYTSLKGKLHKNNEEPEGPLTPKVFSIAATGDVSHNNADFSSSSEGGEEVAAEAKGLLGEILADLQGGKTDKAANKANKAADKTGEAANGAFGSIAAQARGVLSQATQQLSQADESGSGSSSSSSSSSSGSGKGGRNLNRPLTSEERAGAWTLFGIVSGGFLLGGLAKPKKHHDDDSKADYNGNGHGHAAATALPAKAKQSDAASVAVADSVAPQPTIATVEVPVVVVPVPVAPASAAAVSGSGRPVTRASPAERISGAAVAQLSGLSTCEVSDALVKLKEPHGGHLPGIEIFSPHHRDGDVRICGPAFTVKMVNYDDKTAPTPSQHFVDAAEKGSVMVVEAPGGLRSAVWGGLMTARAQYIGVQGVILDGRCRDLEEHRDAKFPVFARGHSTLGQTPFTRPSELQVPITIRDPSLGAEGGFPDLTVRPGDIVLADLDGVVVVSPDLVEKVVELAQRGRETDANCLEDIKSGKGVKETFKKWRGK